MRDGKIVQSGKYKDLLQSDMDFSALVAAHDTSIELVETNSTVSCTESIQAVEVPISPRLNVRVQSDLTTEQGQSKPGKASSKLIEDEERETGRVSLSVYKQYCTESYGWWAVTVVVLVSIFWEIAQLSSDYWLAYETSDGQSFFASLFIGVYSGIAVVSCAFLAMRSLLVAYLSLKTAQSFFKQTLESILHAPMSFFDTTPSGRVLSRVSLTTRSSCLFTWKLHCIFTKRIVFLFPICRHRLINLTLIF